MRFKDLGSEIALTFDDILLLPGYSEVLPKDVDLSTRLTKKIKLNIPLSSAAMDTVTESSMAIGMAKEGGIGIIHKNMSVERQVAELEKVKHAEYWVVKKPITVSPKDSLAKIIELQARFGVSSFPVTEGKKLVGIITERDMLFETDMNKKVEELMTREVISVDHIAEVEEAKEVLHKHRIEKLPFTNKKGELIGMVTVKDIENREKFPDSNKDSEGRFVVGAAVGPKDFDRMELLIKAEADVIVIDTAHGHSKNVIEAVKKAKKSFPEQELIAGNIATRKAAEALISAGADAVKIGLGPGAICTTRVISGVGVPQITAVIECSKACEESNIPLIADGGVKYSGDITKAIAAGADSVMIGSLFAGTDESPGKMVFVGSRKFKQFRGMGSIGAMCEGSSDRYNQGHVKEKEKLVPEGIEGIVPFKGSLQEVIFQLLGGLRSGMGYCGAKSILELRTKTEFNQITKAGLSESHPHDVTITEESPNYSR
ncbi:MAG: IMP dehydrogenase [Candidatus Diapherotrites archaeon]